MEARAEESSKKNLVARFAKDQSPATAIEFRLIAALLASGSPWPGGVSVQRSRDIEHRCDNDAVGIIQPDFCWSSEGASWGAKRPSLLWSTILRRRTWIAGRDKTESSSTGSPPPSGATSGARSKCQESQGDASATTSKRDRPENEWPTWGRECGRRPLHQPANEKKPRRSMETPPGLAAGAPWIGAGEC